MKPFKFTLNDVTLWCHVDDNSNDVITQELRSGNQSKFMEAEALSRLVGTETTLIDIGAHIGLFSLYFSARGHNVFAFEASPLNASLLTQGQILNKFEKLKIYNMAVSDAIGTLNFFEGGPYGFVVTSKTPQLNGCIEVPKIAFDQWHHTPKVSERIIIKMDIEGHELSALRGMVQFLKNKQLPPIFIESNGHCLRWADESPKSLCAFLTELGYKTYVVEGNFEAIREMDSFDIQVPVVQNLLCINDSNLFFRLPKILPKFTQKDTVKQIQRLSKAQHFHQRSYLGNILKKCPELLKKRKIITVLNNLKCDPNQEVVESVNWFNADKASKAYKAKLFIKKLKKIIMKKFFFD